MSDVDFMRRALSLAAAGVGQTGDNPSVGCVIVRDGASACASACSSACGRRARRDCLCDAGTVREAEQ